MPGDDKNSNVRLYTRIRLIAIRKFTINKVLDNNPQGGRREAQTSTDGFGRIPKKGP